MSEGAFSEVLMLKAEQYLNQLGIPLVEKFAGEWDNKKLERYIALLTIRSIYRNY